MNKKIFSKFAMLAFAVGIFGVISTNVFAILTPPTSTTVNNAAPVITVGPSDGSSSSTTPTNVGASTTFTATATDANSDGYYLAICKTDAITIGAAGAAPTCPGTAWGVSTLTTSGNVATVTRTALIGDVESNVWYAFVCDNNTVTGELCSTGNQGSGATGSPFAVNHAPTFGALEVGSATGGAGTIIPGSTVYFHLDANGGTNGIDDNDADTTQDTVRGYICDAATTAMTVPGTCTGGALICSQSTPFNPNTVPFECSSASIAPIPTIDGVKDFKVYVFDSHDFAGTGTTAQTYTVANVAPTVGTYTAGALTLTAGNSTSYSFTVVLSDNNGYADITATNGLIYNDTTVNLASGLCSANELNCYLQPTCTLAGGSSTTITATCSGITAYYNANDTTSSGAVWKAHVNPVDEAGTVTSGADSSTFTVNTLQALNVSEDTIAYGSVAAGSVSSSVTTTLQNSGNIVSDVGIFGSDMTAVSTIGRAQQHWAVLTGFTWGTDDHALQAGATAGGTANTGCANESLAVRTSHSSAAADELIYWKISIPSGTASGTYTGTNTFSAYADTCTGTD